MKNICQFCKAVLIEGEPPMPWILAGEKSECFACHEEVAYLLKQEIEEINKERRATGKPEYGQTYALTGAPGSKCILNGNTWEESKVTDSK